MEIPIAGASWLTLVIAQIKQGILLSDAKCAVIFAHTIERFDRHCFPKRRSPIAIDTGSFPEALADFDTEPPPDRYRVFARGLARGLAKAAEENDLIDSPEGLLKAIQVVAAHEVRHRVQKHCKHLTVYRFLSSRVGAFEKYMRGLIKRGASDHELRMEYDAFMVESRAASLLRDGWDEREVLRIILADAPRR